MADRLSRAGFTCRDGSAALAGDRQILDVGSLGQSAAPFPRRFLYEAPAPGNACSRRRYGPGTSLFTILGSERTALSVTSSVVGRISCQPANQPANSSSLRYEDALSS